MLGRMFIGLFLFLAVAPNSFAQTQKKFVLVAVSGLATGRESGKENLIFSDKLGSDSQVSGVWSNLNKDHKRIYSRAFLTHYSTQQETDAVLDLLINRHTNKCYKGLGLIIMANSWGAAVGNDLARQYEDHCGVQADLFIMVDGISKPFTFGYSKNIYAKTCVNFYQTVDLIHGTEIANCKNIDLFKGVNVKSSLAQAHIRAEWTGSAYGAALIKTFLDSKK